MNRKTFGILAVIAALLAGIAFLAQRGGGTDSIAGESAGQIFVPGLAEALEGIAAIEIRGAGDARLARIERSGDEWVVAEQDSYAAAPGKITALLVALAEARIVEEKTANPEFHARLGVEAVDAAEAPGLEVTLTGSDGTSFELILGDAYGDGNRYARLAASAQSVLIDRNPDIARDPAEWVRPEILAIPSSRVQRVEIEHADDERLVLRKDAPELTDFEVESVPEGRELQYAGIANVTGSVLQNLELDAVSRQTGAPGEVVATTEFRTFDGLVLTVTATAAEEADGQPWLAFSARFDAEQALAFAEETVDAIDANAAAGDEAAAGEPADDAIAEAAELNARLAGWRYRIPAYQYSQMTRRMEDLLRAPPSE